MRSCVVIPARFRSTRLPGKPLAIINGKPMLEHVINKVSMAISSEDIYVATEDERIYNFTNSLGIRAMMTSEAALTGTDRVAEATKDLDYEVIVNVQGDEPMVDPNDIIKCIDLKKQNFDKIINGYAFIKSEEELKSLTVPKVVTNKSDLLLYMSRAPIPYSKRGVANYRECKKQVCIYGFNKEELSWFISQNRKSQVEALEDIEILRFFDMEKKIKMYKCNPHTKAVDTENDRLVVERLLNNAG